MRHLTRVTVGLFATAASGCLFNYSSLMSGAPDGSVRGPELVFIATPSPGFSIDATEVTRRDYRIFLDSVGPATGGQVAQCSWNSSFVPASWPPSDADLDRPVVQVDWCDALAYCRWAGKHLCGAISGGSATYSSPNDLNHDAWYAACSRGGTRAFPYDGSFNSTTCAADTTSTAEVKTFPLCEGGYVGLFDMSGNAREWVDSCDGDSGSTDGCLVRGGGFDDGTAELLDCLATGADSEYRNTQSESLGFRCCSP